MSVIIETSIGDFTVDLYTDERPRCSLNFLKLCKIKYYNFSLFHTIQENLVAQCGDPTATGRGGDSIFGHLYGDQARFFDMEVSPRIKHVKRGLISMVNNGSGMHGSQFVLTLAENLDYLDGKHTVFGEVAEGFEVLDKLNKTFCDEEFRPHQDIRIYHTVILDDPYDDPNGLDIPPDSPGPTQEMLDSDRIACDADIHEDEGKTEEELAEMKAEREAKANTQILEMVGDLPDMDIAPPENVLFVCKLNPVTTSEDLEIIFSRFGDIVSCEIIKDSKTGESLQYAFIEFENKEQCENAYFKMDNVLIDDRRIHVDFSQSVSKIKWKGKGRGVEILPTGKAPSYVLNNQQRRSDGYDLVYEDDMMIKKDKPGRKDDAQKGRNKNATGRGRQMSRSRSKSPVKDSRRDGRKDGWRDRQRNEPRRSDRDEERRYEERDDRRRRDGGGRDERRRQDGGGRDERRGDGGGRDGRRSPLRHIERSKSRDRDRIENRERGRRGEIERDRRRDSRERERRSPDRRDSRDRDSRREDRDRFQSGRDRERDSSPPQGGRNGRLRIDSQERIRERSRSREERIDRGRKRSPSFEQISRKTRRDVDSVDREQSPGPKKSQKLKRKDVSSDSESESKSKKKRSKKKSKKTQPDSSDEDSDDGSESGEEDRKKKQKKSKKKRAGSPQSSDDESERKKKKKKKSSSKRHDSSNEEEEQSDSGSERREKKKKESKKHKKHKSRR